MNKQIVKQMVDLRLSHPYKPTYYERLDALARQLEARVGGKRGAQEARERLFRAARAYLSMVGKAPATPTREARLMAWKRREAERLGEMAGYITDEHGTYRRGDHWFVTGIDFVPAWEAAQAPYCDMGGEGLGLIRVSRKRVYARSSKWRPSWAASYYVVGRNEAGTYFAHPVPEGCGSVEEALDWIWSGKGGAIIARQGDIALIRGNGPKLPPLPDGHAIQDGWIVHPTHPPIPLPGKGERIIVARRANARVDKGTRD